MTIAQIYEEAKRQLDKGVITIGEFSEIVDREYQEPSKWIPISSRKLPKFGEKVLVHITNIDGVEYDVACLKDTKHAAYDADCYWSGKFAYGLKNVIEWKPIESNSENPNGWISVSERLPEKEGLYLVSVKNDHERRYSKTCWFHSENDWFARQDIIAWMPLPEPYKAEKEEEE